MARSDWLDVWDRYHVCDNCSKTQRIVHTVGMYSLRVFWVIGVLLMGLSAIFLFWYSPGIFHTARAQYGAYSTCVDSMPLSETIGDMMRTRRVCAEVASQLRVRFPQTR